MAQLNFGVVGTGFIAGAVGDAIVAAPGARLAAVASRSAERARAFAAEHGAGAGVEGWQALIARDDVAALYIATPTVAKEEIALAAVEAGKHILVDKPFMNAASAQRMADAAAAKGLVFMDGTHFVHHPRTHAIKAATAEKIGTPRSLHAAFYFPFDDRENIRFDRTQEPTGALGDLAWYAMRAAVEYLRPDGAPTKVSAVADRDPGTGAVIRVVGMLAFADGTVSTFDCGFTCGTLVMELNLLGTSGIVTMDDFVLDYNNSLVFQNPDIQPRYVHRTGMDHRGMFRPVEVPAAHGQHVLMIESFAALAAGGDAKAAAAHARATVATQGYLDAVWAEIGG